MHNQELEVIASNPQCFSGKEIFEALGLKYSDKLMVDDKDPIVRLLDPKKCLDSFIAEGSDEAKEVNRRALAKPDRKLQLAVCYLTDEIGYGLFTLSKIPRGTVIGEYTGLLHTKARFLGEAGAVPIIGKYDFRYGTENAPLPMYGNFLMVDAEHVGNETRFMNHSQYTSMFCLPNGRHIKGPNVEVSIGFADSLYHIWFFARRNIFPGEELRFFYGSGFQLHQKHQRNLYYLDSRKNLVKLTRIDKER